MIHHITLTGRSIALACDGTVTTQHGAGGATGAVYVEASHLTLLHDMRDGEFYRTGQNSWSPSGWRRLSEAPMRIADEQRRRTADDAPWDDPARHHSAWMAVLEDSAGALLVGCLDGRTPRLRADTAVLEAFTESGDPARWVILPGPATAVMARYARELGESLGGREIEPQSVWCSWYSYYEGISQEALEREIPQVAELGFKTLQIDDGWEVAVGDWEAGESFGDGMEAAATRIREAGMQPGLWVAPFIALPGSRAVRDYPEMFVHNADGGLAVAGSNWGGDYYALDTTHPTAQTYVRKLIAKIVHRWGFSYLKLDFINAAAIPGYRHRQIDREEAYRTGLRLVRDTAGDETFLLGSGAARRGAGGAGRGPHVGELRLRRLIRRQGLQRPARRHQPALAGPGHRGRPRRRLLPPPPQPPGRHPDAVAARRGRGQPLPVPVGPDDLARRGGEGGRARLPGRRGRAPGDPGPLPLQPG